MSSSEERNGVPLMGFGTMEHADGSVKPDVMFEVIVLRIRCDNMRCSHGNAATRQ